MKVNKNLQKGFKRDYTMQPWSADEKQIPTTLPETIPDNFVKIQLS